MDFIESRSEEERYLNMFRCRLESAGEYFVGRDGIVTPKHRIVHTYDPKEFPDVESQYKWLTYVSDRHLPKEDYIDFSDIEDYLKKYRYVIMPIVHRFVDDIHSSVAIFKQEDKEVLVYDPCPLPSIVNSEDSMYEIWKDSMRFYFQNSSWTPKFSDEYSYYHQDVNTSSCMLWCWVFTSKYVECEDRVFDIDREELIEKTMATAKYLGKFPENLILKDMRM